MKVFMLVGMVALCAALSGCKIEVTVPDGGRVVSESETYECSSTSPCVIEVTDTDFDETFMAIPDEGYVFSGWKRIKDSLCGGKSEPCRLYTSGFPGNDALMDVLGSDRSFYLTPVFDKAEVRLATFNIQSFGNTKIGKPDVVDELVRIVRKFDVIAVQEIKNIAQTVPYEFLDAINSKAGAKYEIALSQRGGLQADDANYVEQYAYYYNTQKIEVLTDFGLFPDGDSDLFQREPFVVRFEAKKGGFSFVLITVHTSPSVAVEEIRALDDVFQWAQTVAGTEDDFIALGDFNQGCSYASPGDLAGSNIVENYYYIVPDTADTNFSDSSVCAYDRIVITPNTEDEYSGSWGIESVSDNSVSDHFPVWANFSSIEGSGDSGLCESADNPEIIDVSVGSRDATSLLSPRLEFQVSIDSTAEVQSVNTAFSHVSGGQSWIPLTKNSSGWGKNHILSASAPSGEYVLRNLSVKTDQCSFEYTQSQLESAGHRLRTFVDTSPPEPPSSPYQCGTKNTCGEMNSCAEARYFLTVCGVTRLDGDGDGTPCESICGG